MAQRAWHAAWVMVGVVAVAGAAHAAHPLQTEDTGTQGEGNFELENGLSWSRAAGARAFSYQPQLSYGIAPSVDLIVQPSWLRNRDQTGLVARGSGDTNLDAKWRFFGEAPVSLGARAGVALATGQNELGIPHGKIGTHGILVVTYDAAPLTIHGNLGWTHSPSEPGARSSIVRVSSALMWAANEQWTLTVDGGAEQNADAGRRSWPGSLLAGAIYSVRAGLDVDVGYQSSVHTDVAAHKWLMGITYRFAP